MEQEKPQAKTQQRTKVVKIPEVLAKNLGACLQKIDTQVWYLTHLQREKMHKIQLHNVQMCTFSIEAELVRANLMAEKFS